MEDVVKPMEDILRVGESWSCDGPSGLLPVVRCPAVRCPAVHAGFTLASFLLPQCLAWGPKRMGCLPSAELSQTECSLAHRLPEGQTSSI